MKTILSLTQKVVLISMILFLKTLKAQEPCGYEKALEYQMANDPTYKKRMSQIEMRIQGFLETQGQSKLQTQVIDIPVVVHVIHMGEAVGAGTNISDAQIMAAIQTANDMYKNTNGTGVNMQINFCLAQRDPNGNPSTGINRVSGVGISSYTNNGMFALQGVSPGTCTNNNNVVKDLSKWPPANYLNIWVVKGYCLQSGWTLYGQASGQTGSVYDGVTMLYSEMAGSKLTLGHEIGHMLLLNHTFQGDGTGSTCPVDNSCANDGDLICDTPPHKRGDWGVANPCTASGVWDNSRYNYMAYAWANLPASFNETNCRFTQGQKDRARAAIYSIPFVNYLNSLGCTPASVADAGIERFLFPVETMYTSNCSAASTLNPQVQLRNYGTGTLSSVAIKYRVDNGAVNNYAWSGNLLKDSSVMVTLPAVSVSQGAHTLWAFTSSPNGGADGYTANDSANFATTLVLKQTSSPGLATTVSDPVCFGSANGSATVVATSSPSKFEIKEDFEGSATDWKIVNGSEVNHWMIGTATSNGGVKSLYVTNDNAANAYQDNASSSVHFYKDFYFPAGATNIKVKFDWKCDGEAGGFNGVDRLRVYLIPTTQLPQPSYQLGVSPAYTLTSIGSYVSQSTFKTDSITGLDANAGSAKRLVFNWRNNSAAGTQVPAAVDNIIVSYDLPNISTYTYSWSSAPAQATPVASALGAGTYTVVVTDANNCQSSASVVLTDPAPIVVTLSAPTQTVCVNGGAIALTGSPSGGIYSGTGVSGSLFDPTVSDTGTCSLLYNYTDMNGCSNSDSLQMVVQGCTGIGQAEEQQNVTVFPNPANENITITGLVATDLQLVNEVGQVMRLVHLSAKNNFSVRLEDLAPGVYFLLGGNEIKSVKEKILVVR